MNEKLIQELQDALLAALPFVENAEEDPAYKTGAVAKITKQVKTAIEAAEGVAA